MRRIIRWLGYALGALAVLFLIFAAWVWLASSHAFNRAYAAQPERLPPVGSADAAEGDRLIHVFGCVECHGKGLRGRLVFEEPNVAKVWAPNLTLVAAQASDAQLAQAIRQGIGRDGHALWVMPSPLYSRMTDRELALVIAAVRRQPRGGSVQPDVAVGPLGRMGIALGKFRSAPEQIAEFRARQPFYVGRDHEAGRLLAGKVCGDCHAPDLRGGQPGFGHTPPDLAAAAAYSPEEFRRLMRTGRPPDGRDLGLMRVIAEQGLSSLRDDEIAAIHAYLKARAAKAGV